MCAIYGSAPGAYGAGLQGLIDSGQWDGRADLAEAFLNWSQWDYGAVGEPLKDRSGLENRLREVELVLHNQDNREHDLLDSDDYYQFQGRRRPLRPSKVKLQPCGLGITAGRAAQAQTIATGARQSDPQPPFESPMDSGNGQTRIQGRL